jgi:molybdenum cofactor biosynthesis protein B
MSYQQHLEQSQAISARCAVITLSDTRTAANDTGGEIIRRLLGSAGHAVIASHLIPDDAATLQPLLSELLGGSAVDVILSTGGTGVARRDVTIDVAERAIVRRLDGFGELFRMLSYQQIGSGAMLSRAIGGIAGGRADKLLFAMPGSPKAVELAMTQLILPELKHLLREMRK